MAVGNGNPKGLTMKHRTSGTTDHNMSSSSLRKQSHQNLVSKVPWSHLSLVILGSKLSVLFPAIPAAILAQCFGFARLWVFALSLIGLVLLAERFTFLTEQIAYYTGPTVAALLKATCGNASELIMAIFSLSQQRIEEVKLSLLRSIFSNLVLVLCTSFLYSGVAKKSNEQKYDRREADMNSLVLMLMLALLCHLLPILLFACSKVSAGPRVDPTLHLSRAASVVMLILYTAYIVLQWRTYLVIAKEKSNKNGATDKKLDGGHEHRTDDEATDRKSNHDAVTDQTSDSVGVIDEQLSHVGDTDEKVRHNDELDGSVGTDQKSDGGVIDEQSSHVGDTDEKVGHNDELDGSVVTDQKSDGGVIDEQSSHVGDTDEKVGHNDELYGSVVTDQKSDQESDDEKEAAVIALGGAIVWLIGMTAVTTFFSDYMVDTIEDIAHSWGLSLSFISIIIIPIVGNAAEHVAGVIFAFNDKSDLSMGVALGSTTQIAMCMIPSCVVVSWIMGIDLDLNFSLLVIASLALSLISPASRLQGTSTYLKGLVLMLCYIVVGACFSVYESPFNQSSLGYRPGT